MKMTAEGALVSFKYLVEDFLDELGDGPKEVPKKSRSPEVIGQLNELFHSVLGEPPG